MRTDWQTGLHNEKLEQHTDWDGQMVNHGPIKVIK